MQTSDLKPNCGHALKATLVLVGLTGRVTTGLSNQCDISIQIIDRRQRGGKGTSHIRPARKCQADDL